ncbi:uncharacterized protein LOC126907933 [Daktulosphaira vitifoliae]|uniref:uncharacterized protein LOC126907933 n=1 Tax=Daktulosphaira vitifoliae TaxID=58002 RepID=UPI0021A99C8C|nr:uncharacterized protein LOC126907933 [Daktulosphaira vitifoliae]
MNIKLLTLLFYTTSIFLKIGLVDCKTNRKAYTKYFKQVTKHIRVQFTKMNLEHLSVKTDKDKMSIKEFLENSLCNICEVFETFHKIVDLINYLYTEVLQIFTEHLKIIIDDCKNYFEKNSFKDAIYCTVVILNATKNSNMMFEYLYKAITFIDYLDIKLVSKNSLIRPKTVAEEIYTVKNYTFLMKTSELLNYVNNDESIKIEEAKEDYKEINNFFNKLVAITRKDFKTNFNIINSTMKYNLREKYYTEYTTDEHKIKFVDFVKEKLKAYCFETINNYYIKIGFNQLLDSSIAEFIPPRNIDVSQCKAIEVLNTLFREGDWKLLNHIKIICGDITITTDQIIRDTVDDHNINLKKRYFTQLIRCKYTEVLSKYNTYMSAIIQTCLCEITKKNVTGYVDCIIQFFDAVKNSKEMFKYMLSAIDTLKVTSIWELHKSHACLKQTYFLLSSFFPNIEHINLTKSDFFNLSNDEKKIKADNFLSDFKKARIQFDRILFTRNVYACNYCLINGENINQNQLMQSWATILLSANTNNTTGSPIILYDYALTQFRTFCNVAITSVYDCLGFNKIKI